MKVFKIREVTTVEVDVYVDANSKEEALHMYHEGQPAAWRQPGIDYRLPRHHETVVAYCEETENPT